MKRDNDILSVIVPVYNVAPYLKRCLDSILNQTYRVKEIICVNDGSTDESLAILESYSLLDSRIKIINKTNGGLVSARKAGLSQAQGEYVAYVDSDDWIEENMYQEMMNVAIEIDADIVTSGCVRDYGDHCVIEKEGIAAGKYFGSNLVHELQMKMIDTEVFFKSNISLHTVNKVYKRDLIMRWQFEVNDYINVGEDAACAYMCILNADCVAVVDACYYHYCIRNDSIMGKKDENEWKRYQVLFELLKYEFSKHENEIINIMEQYWLIRCYFILLRFPDKIINYKQGCLFPFGNIDRGSRVIIYGAGRFGQELKVIMDNTDHCEVVAWVDQKKSSGVGDLQDIKTIEYDVVLMAALVNDIVQEMRETLMSEGVNSDKMYSLNILSLFELKDLEEK